MRSISFNWTKGGCMGGLRMAYHNVRRVTDCFRHNQQVSDLAYEIEGKILALQNLVAAAKGPRRHAS